MLGTCSGNGDCQQVALRVNGVSVMNVLCAGPPRRGLWAKTSQEGKGVIKVRFMCEYRTMYVLVSGPHNKLDTSTLRIRDISFDMAHVLA